MAEGKNREELVREIVDLIVESVNLRHLDKKAITAETALVGSELQLDSLDILEVIVALEKRFQVKIKNVEDGKRVFQNIGTIADFVQSDATAF